MKFLLVVVALVSLVGAQIPACPPLTDTPIPNDARLLDLTNLRAVAAMGDSITAGFAISGAGESPDRVFSIGGADGVPSAANLLRNQNPRIVGLSENGQRGFNVGLSGDVSAGMQAQALTLSELFANSSEIDFVNDWKLVTIWIGGNNICRACDGGAADTAEQYERDLDAAVNVLFERVPRIVVNLVSQFNFSSMFDVSGNELRCFLNRILCPCIMTGPDEQRDEMNRLCQDQNAAMRAITDKYNAGPRADFGVILQTMGYDSAIPGIEYLATLDCFHPSALSHDAIGINGFNQLFVPPQLRSREIDFAARAICATDDNKRIFIG